MHGMERRLVRIALSDCPQHSSPGPLELSDQSTRIAIARLRSHLHNRCNTVTVMDPNPCRACGCERPDARFWFCSLTCMRWFWTNHVGPAARAWAIWLATDVDGNVRCRRCNDVCDDESLNRSAEVHHRAYRGPRANRPWFGCHHHQENLEVLCHVCHNRATRIERGQRY